MQLFYHPEATTSNDLFSFPKEESNHICRVLRKKEGDTLHVTNGKGDLFTTSLVLASPSKCTVKISETKHYSAPEHQIHLVVAPTKMNERYEWFLEKVTEMGCTSITPIICEHSERKVIKTDRMEKIIMSAMKQSNQYHLPVLNEVISFKKYMELDKSGTLFIAHCEETERTPLKKALHKASNEIHILIGPEGDFSPSEIELAKQNEFQPITLGETRLRTETAAIVACHTVVLHHEKI